MAPGRTTSSTHYSDDMAPAWSPDGQQLAFHSYRDGNNEIYLMDRDSEEVTRLTYNSEWDIRPSWSPDGQMIAFHSRRDGNYEVYTMRVDGSQQQRLTTAPFFDGFADWKP